MVFPLLQTQRCLFSTLMATRWAEGRLGSGDSLQQKGESSHQTSLHHQGERLRSQPRALQRKSALGRN